MQFNQKLQKMLDARGWTAYRLAKIMDISQSTVSHWLAGESQPQRRTMRQLEDVFGVPYGYLSEDISELQMELDVLTLHLKEKNVMLNDLLERDADHLEVARTTRQIHDLQAQISLLRSKIAVSEHENAALIVEDGLQDLKDDERVLLEHYRTMTEEDRDMMRDLARRLTHAD